jgi:hypothetical protein
LRSRREIAGREREEERKSSEKRREREEREERRRFESISMLVVEVLKV